MTTVLIVLCLCSSLSSSAVAGLFTGGVIPNTEPHYLKVIQADRAKAVFDPIKPVISEYKDKFTKPGSDGFDKKEDVKIEDIKSFVEEKVGKEKCKLMIRELTEVLELENNESDKPPSTVFSLSGNKEKSGILYEYMGVTGKDLEIGSSLCGLIKS
jgi:hypothetical protein